MSQFLRLLADKPHYPYAPEVLAQNLLPGIPGNLIRILPKHLSAYINLDSWLMSKIFKTIKMSY